MTTKTDTQGNFKGDITIPYSTDMVDNATLVLKSTELHNIKNEPECVQILKVNQEVRNADLKKD